MSITTLHSNITIAWSEAWLLLRKGLVFLSIKFKPVMQGLFGRQIPYAIKKNITVYPIREIVENLCNIDDLSWGKYAFSREPLNGKFNDEQRLELTQQAIECGIKTARDCIQQAGTNDPIEIVNKMGLHIDYPAMPQNSERVLFAEFFVPNLIHIYMDGVDKAQKLLSDPSVALVLTSRLQISSLLIAHELFHFIEEQQKNEIWTRSYRFNLWTLGPFQNRSAIAVLSEIAAMSFSKELTGLSYSPYIMDAFLVYGYSPEFSSALYEEMMQFAGKEHLLKKAKIKGV